MAIRAVLFDVGGPIDTEVSSERVIDRQIGEAVAAVGRPASPEQVIAASDWAVSVFAPDAYAAMIWRLCGEDGELARQAYEAFRNGGERLKERIESGIELREGMPILLKGLHGRGLLLGLAANQPARIIATLDGHGIGHLFAHREVSGHHGYRKPDVRLFLRACEDLGVEPKECVMVGDRIDNDIVPARLLGMRTVLFRTGRHVGQRPRCANEVPDAEVWDVGQLAEALERLTGPGA